MHPAPFVSCSSVAQSEPPTRSHAIAHTICMLSCSASVHHAGNTASLDMVACSGVRGVPTNRHWFFVAAAHRSLRRVSARLDRWNAPHDDACARSTCHTKHAGEARPSKAPPSTCACAVMRKTVLFPAAPRFRKARDRIALAARSPSLYLRHLKI
jgi:hypothetical protein